MPARDTARAMSEENVKLVHQAYEAFNRRDIDAFLALTDPDLEFTPAIRELEGSAPYRGHDDVRSWWQDMFTVFPDYGIEIDEVRDLGDVTVVRAHLRGRGVESDAPVVQTFWQVAEWRKGKGVWWHSFRSEAEALEAARLRE